VKTSTYYTNEISFDDTQHHISSAVFFTIMTQIINMIKEYPSIFEFEFIHYSISYIFHYVISHIALLLARCPLCIPVIVSKG